MRLIISIIRYISSIVYIYLNYLNFKLHGVQIGKQFKISGIIFVRKRGCVVRIGDNFKASSGISYNPIGGDTILRFFARMGGEIHIGDNVGISNSTIYCENKIVIEDCALIGGGCKIWDTDFHSLDPYIRGSVNDKGSSKPILIKKNAFIGGGSFILKGVVIGENSIIAAGSVVTKSVPDNQIWGGNPAKFIRHLV